MVESIIFASYALALIVIFLFEDTIKNLKAKPKKILGVVFKMHTLITMVTLVIFVFVSGEVYNKENAGLFLLATIVFPIEFKIIGQFFK